MIPYNQQALNIIRRNKENVDRGIPNEIPIGLPRLESLIYGVSQEVYYLVAGGTGSGKTKFVDLNFVLKPLAYVRKTQTPIDVEVVYFSLEISGAIKAINLASFYIFAKYGVSLSPSQLQSRKYNLSAEEYRYAEEGMEWVNNLSDKLHIYDDKLSAKKMYGILKSFSEKRGTWTKNPETKEETYVPNNPYLYTIIIIDHLGLITESEGKSKKQEIDQLSRYLIWFRNKCRYTPIAVSQYNRGMEGTDRVKFNALTPQLSDLKETGNPAEDANVVLALFPPLRFRLDEYRGYDIKRLLDRIRTITVLKNRDGPAEKTIGLAFYGEIGYFNELPKGKEMQEDDYIKVINYLEEWKTKKEKKQKIQDQEANDQ